MQFREWLTESRFFHVTKKGIGDLIRQSGFKINTTRYNELGPGIYLAKERPAFPTHLKSTQTGEIYETEVIEVGLRPGLKFVKLNSESPNPALSLYRILYGDDYLKRYEADQGPIGKSKIHNEKGLINWPFIHEQLKQAGYDGIERTERWGDVGNTDLVVFDPKNVFVI